MSDDKAPNNVIQFPGGKKKDAEPAAPQAHTPSTAVATAKKPARKPTTKKAKAATAGTVLAIALMTGAFNRFTFNQNMNSLDASSSSGRAIASVGHAPEWKRDADWEKTLAESLASAQERSVASTGLGHAATAEERLRWGTLEEKYTIVYKSDVHNIEMITLQDTGTNPAYILDRNKFLKDYGSLLEDGFASAQLSSVEVNHDRTVESYTLYDKDKRPKGEVHFELDIHKRLLSLKVESAKI